MSQAIHHQVVIVGGGTAGISVAARLTNGWFNKRDVAVIEPAVLITTSRSGRWSMWLVKRYLLPQLYWHGMLKGWM